MREALCQKWEEVEYGWGRRPDGYSLHLSEDDLKTFIQKNEARSLKDIRLYGLLPFCDHSTPCGTPYWCEIDAKTYRKLKRNKMNKRKNHGLWFNGIPP